MTAAYAPTAPLTPPPTTAPAPADQAADDVVFNPQKYAPPAAAVAPSTAPDISGGYHISKPPPPLPQEDDPSLLARVAIAEGGPSVAGQQAVVQGMLARQKESGQNLSQLVAAPGQIESYWNGHVQAVDPTTPQFKSIYQYAQTAQPSTTFDSWGNPAVIAQRGWGKMPFDPSTGVMIGGQMFGKAGATAQPNANGLTAAQQDALDAISAGGAAGGGDTTPDIMTPDERKQWDALGGPQQATIMGGGPNNQWTKATNPQSDAYKVLALHGFLSPSDPSGSYWNPQAAPPGNAQYPTSVGVGMQPQDPGTFYVTTNGKVRQSGSDVDDYLPIIRNSIKTRGTPLQQAGAGAAETVNDVGRSGAELGFGVGTGDPIADAFAQTQGGPSAFDQYQAGNRYFAQQQENYLQREWGSRWAQAGHFGTQAATGIATASLVPEAEAPEAVAEGADVLGGALRGMLPRIENLGPNAARGALSQVPLVGANPNVNPALQIATAGVLGSAAPEVLRPLGAAGGAAGVLLRKSAIDPASIPPDVLDLANTAITKYGIPLRASQIGGQVDRSLATRDSNLISTQFAGNNNQQIAAFNKALVDHTGADPGFVAPTRAALDSGRAATGAIYDDLTGRYSIPNASGLMTNLEGLVQDAKGAIPAGDLSPLQHQLDNVRSLVQPDGSISGAGVKGLTDTGSSLDALAGSDGPIAGYGMRFRNLIDQSFREGMTPEDQAALDTADSQWKWIKTLEPLVAKAGPTGMVSPTGFGSRVTTNRFTKGLMSTADVSGPDTDMQELADIGGRIMKEPPNSNTAGRLKDLAIHNALPTALGGAAGWEAVAQNPDLALKAGAAAIAAKGIDMGASALTNYRLGPSAGAALAGANAPRSALSGVVPRAAVPLSALLGTQQESDTPIINPALGPPTVWTHP